ncbi:hypothetical protein QBC38DRAFT_463918 [Podospora fimiseda]|uniref:Uncharacterized protein n=1 Tax=Podospora fimiseda TaxID=252190 RepID=A0AAN7BZJ4_9PEZI|nr:hypothetical protein QBC38DRAFT_463918 [Podospora fimiseda]
MGQLSFFAFGYVFWRRGRAQGGFGTECFWEYFYEIPPPPPSSHRVSFFLAFCVRYFFFLWELLSLPIFWMDMGRLTNHLCNASW